MLKWLTWIAVVVLVPVTYWSAVSCLLAADVVGQGEYVDQLRAANPRWDCSAWSDASKILDENGTLGAGAAEDPDGECVSVFQRKQVEAIRIFDYWDRTSWADWAAPTRNETETRLKELQQFTGLHYLGIEGGIGLKDTDLSHLTGLNVLHTLEICGERWLSDTAVESNTMPLDGLEYRRARYKWHSITDVGVMHIAHLTNLRRLVLECPDVTDTGVERLANLTGLTYLSLNGCAITGKGIAAIQCLDQMEELHCRDTSFGDQSVKFLTTMVALKIVDISGTAVSDAGLMQLVGCPLLETVYVYGTRCTSFGVKALNEQRVASCHKEVSVYGVE